MRSISIFVGLLLCAVAGKTSADDRTAGAMRGTLLWISDIHFDPYAGGQVVRLANESKTGWRDHTQWGEILETMPGHRSCAPAGSDANDFLFRKILDGAVSQLSRRPDCILVTGDFLAHDFNHSYFSRNLLPASLTTAVLYNRFVDQSLAYLAMRVSEAFPGVPVIATLGNNDAYCGDYGIRGNSGFLTAARRTFRRYFLPDLSRDFETYGGCYETGVPGTDHTFVVLNSVPFISDYPESWRLTGTRPLQRACSPLRSVDLVDEFNWFTETVKSCRGQQKSWIVCHVPPGVACYDGTQNWPRPVPKGTEQVPFVNEFTDFYLSQRQHLAGILTGHSHNAEFKLIRDSTGSQKPVSFVLMAPSIGRNHGNHASFRVMSFDRTSLRIEDYTTHWLNSDRSPPKWGTPFRFTECYGQPDVSADSLSSVFQGMISGAMAPTGKSFLDQYFFDYSTRTGAAGSRPRTHYQKAVGSILGP